MSSLRGGRTAPRPAVPGQKSLLAVDLAEPVAKLERAAEFADWDAGNVRSEVREELQASLRLLDRVDHVTEADRHVQKLHGDKTERVVGGIRDVQRQLTSQWRSLQHQEQVGALHASLTQLDCH
mmetsp:Transcript_90490/g.207102  ORF Transcript_90490/g.207102 Transcript_90490/m.207102 type:complete len:124 (+) Transcript_90490:109-480(+)